MKRIHVVQLVLFLLTLIFTTITGAELRHGASLFYGNSLEFLELGSGLWYSLSFLLFLGAHEFGHYLIAARNQVKVTLPFFIPFYLGFISTFAGLVSIGSLGAFISIRSIVKSRKAYFDIGIAGPLAGFAVVLVIIAIGFLTLPPLEYIYGIHPEYLPLQENYSDYTPPAGQTALVFRFGSNLLFQIFEAVMPYDPVLYPYENEVLHYPFLMVGYLGLFLTALNLLPIGQLDGGHIVYGLFGKRYHGIISRVAYLIFLFYAGLGFLKPGNFDFIFVGWSVMYIYFLYVCLFNVTTERQNRLVMAVAIFSGQFLLIYAFPAIEGYPGWLLFAFIVGRIIGIDHPETVDAQPLDLKRKALGVLSLVIFILCFSPKPFIYETITGEKDHDHEAPKTETVTHTHHEDFEEEES